MPHWPELGHVATHSCKGGWEIQSLFGMAILAQFKIRRESIWGGIMSRLCPGKILLPIFFYRWENLEDGHSTKVTAFVSDELGFTKSYFVTFFFLMHLVSVRSSLLTSLCCSEERNYTKLVQNYTKFYSLILTSLLILSNRNFKRAAISGAENSVQTKNKWDFFLLQGMWANGPALFMPQRVCEQ